MTPPSAASSQLLPYVPRLVVDWLATTPGVEARTLDGTLMFADISGFTALTERLSRRGKAGAEEMGEALNATFDHLLADAYEHGAGLLKWGGDAVLLAFEGRGHAARACRSARLMQRTIADVGRLRTSAGPVRLGMSIGVHTGSVDLLLPHTPTRELLVVGPAATAVTTMEKHAERGQVVVSASTAQALQRETGVACRRPVGPGFLLEDDVEILDRLATVRPVEPGSVDLGRAMEPSLAAHVIDGPVAPEHRRIAVGFVRFSGVDDLFARSGRDGVLEALRTLLARTQTAVAAHEVTLLSTDVDADGGKLIVVSGAPRSTGDDEARVLAAVHEIMDDDGPLTLRAGVNHGRVFAGDYGPAYRRVYSVAGDCVNLAARLMAAADPGQIRTLRSVLDRSRTEYDAVELPAFEAKGKSEPVRSWAVGEPRSAPAVLRAPMIGREDELSVLLTEAQATRSVGRVLRLSAERGMGKSRLVEELLLRSPFKVLRMTGEPYAATTPYAPWRRVMRHALDLPADAPADAVAAELMRHGERRADLAGWLPLIGSVAGVDLPVTEAISALDPRFRQRVLEEQATIWLSRNLPGPVVLVFEDLHLMDQASLSLLQRFIDTADERTWLVVVVHPRELEVPVAFPAEHVVLELPPLSDDAALALLHQSRADRVVPPHRLDEVVRRARGNPLFLTELLAAVLAGTDVADLPAGVEQLAAARIDRLPPRARRVVRAVAVLGAGVERDLLEEVLGMPVDLEGIEDFVVAAGDGRLDFTHPVLREAAYEGLPYGRRRDLHAAAAAAIRRRQGDMVEEVDAVLSEHHLAAHDWGSAWECSVRAGEAARRSNAPQEALLLFERALRAARGGAEVTAEQRREVEVAVGDLAYSLGDFDTAHAAFGRARRSLRALVARGASGAGAPDALVELADLGLRTARVMERHGRLSQALAWLTRAEGELGAREDRSATAARSRILARAGWIRYLQGHPSTALRLIRRAEQAAEEAGEAAALAFALRVHDLVEIDLGRLSESPHGVRALALLGPFADQAERGHTHSCLGVRAYHQGDWAEAASHYRKAQECYRRAGDRWQSAVMEVNLAELLIDRGRTGEGAELVSRTLPVWESAGQPAEVAFGRMLLGRAALAEGRFDDAREELRTASTLFEDAGERGSLRQVATCLAEIDVRSGRPAVAIDAISGLITSSPPGDQGIVTLERLRGEALVLLGHLAQGTEAIEHSIRLARSRGAVHEVALGLDALDRHGVVLGTAARAERDAICARLGIVLQAAPAAAG
ncbi:adenylate/guanylate cyclase domain-containing protein [Nocardioides sp.]|uniref:adenylate/guanylate cyclase domain-containing protein n=1 Tax=Nocardioides sp. TaxID=35761 RepID=UPI0035136229